MLYVSGDGAVSPTDDIRGGDRDKQARARRQPTDRPARVASPWRAVQIDGDRHPPKRNLVVVLWRFRSERDAHRRSSSFRGCGRKRNRTRPPLPSLVLPVRVRSAAERSAVGSTAPLHFRLAPRQNRSRAEERNLPNLTDAFRPSSAPPTPKLPKYQPTDSEPASAPIQSNPKESKETRPPRPRSIPPPKLAILAARPGDPVAGGEARRRPIRGSAREIDRGLNPGVLCSLKPRGEPRRRRRRPPCVPGGTGWLPAAGLAHGAPRAALGGRTDRYPELDSA